MQDTIERELHIDAPIERVWSLLTDAEHLGTWFGDAGAEIDLRPGGDLTLSWHKEEAEGGRVDHRGRVERVEEPNLFAFRWGRQAGYDEAESTLVEFTLSEADPGTRLRMVESGFASLPDAQSRYDSHSEGWETELGHLAGHAREPGE